MKALLLFPLLFLAGCQPRVWTEEPTAFLGITLGQPLSASVPLCRPFKGKAVIGHTCASSSDDVTSLENTPDNLGSVYVTQQGGVVDSISVSVSFAQMRSVREDLIQRYGKPTNQSTYKEAHTDSWHGRILNMDLFDSGELNGGSVILQLELSPIPDKPHVNPF